MDTAHIQNESILKELSDIKASLAVNTSETSNIKGTIAEIKTDLREIKANFVTQAQLKVLIDLTVDHEGRMRTLESKAESAETTRRIVYGVMGLLGLSLITALFKYFIK